MIIRHSFVAKGVIGLFALLMAISCAGGATQPKSQATAQPTAPQVMRGLQKTKVDSVQPGVLALEAGKSMGAVISGSGLTEARTLQGERNNQPIKSITGAVRCGRTPSCSLTLSTRSQTPAGTYKVALLDKNQQFLTYLPIYLTVEAKAPAANATISSMQPAKLVVEAGNSLETTIIGNGLNTAQSVEGSLGKEPDKTISGGVNCGRGRSCVVTLSTESETPAGDYQIDLLDRDRKFLVTLPSKLTVDVKDAPPIRISSVEPSKLTVEPGQAIAALIKGKGLNAIQGAEAQVQGRAVSDIQGRISCRSENECQLDLTTTRRAQVGQYLIALLGVRGQTLATLPSQLFITEVFVDNTPTPPTNVGNPDVVTVLGADPTISIQRSCTAGPHDTSVTPLTPNNGELLFPQSVTRWSRTDHAKCVPPSSYTICESQPFERFYELIVCGSTCDTHFLVQACIEPGYLGSGEYLWDSATVETMRTTLGAAYGASLNWAARYHDDEGGSLVGEWSEWAQFTLASDAPAPGQPILYYPPHNHTIGREVLHFQWDKENSDPQANYKICLQEASASTGCATPEIDSENRSINLSEDDFISRGLYGKKIEYKVRTCNVDNECGPYSEPFELFAPPPPAVIYGPDSLAEASLPITLPWQSVAGASSYKFKMHSAFPPYVSRVIEVGNTTSYLLTAEELSPGCFDQSFKWKVQTCKIIEGVEICSSPTFADNVHAGRKEKFLLPTNAPTGTCDPDQPGPGPNPNQVNFADDLAPVFGSPSCTNCHGLRSGTSQLPAGHIAVSVNAASCGTCHDNAVQDTLEDATGQNYADLDLLNVQWHAAPLGMDFNSVSNVTTLCTMAQDPGSVATDDTQYPASLAPLEAIERHLSYDPLILWAVLGGKLPPNSNRTNVAAAFNGTLQQWRALVSDWVAAGTPCQ